MSQAMCNKIAKALRKSPEELCVKTSKHFFEKLHQEVLQMTMLETNKLTFLKPENMTVYDLKVLCEIMVKYRIVKDSDEFDYEEEDVLGNMFNDPEY